MRGLGGGGRARRRAAGQVLNGCCCAGIQQHVQQGFSSPAGSSLHLWDMLQGRSEVARYSFPAPPPAVAAQPAASHGVTRRTGPVPSGGGPAATHDSKGLAARASKKVTLKLPRTGTAGLGGVLSGGPEMSLGLSGGGLPSLEVSPTASEVLQPAPWLATVSVGGRWA